MLVYGCTLLLRADCTPHLVAGVVSNWLRFKKQIRLDADELLAPKHTRIRDGHVTTAVAAGEYPELWAFRYEHSDSAVSGRQWITEIGIRRARADDLLECSVIVSTSEVSARVAAPVTVSRPSVVNDLAEACGVSSTPGLVTRELTVDDAEAFAYGLDDERRKHAYVVVSPTPEGAYLVDPKRARLLLVGLADVVTIKHGADTFLLERELGRRISVWGGAVNIIFPVSRFQDGGFIPTRRLMPEDLAQLVERGIPPEVEILSILTHRTNLPISWRATTVERVREFDMRRTLASKMAEAKGSGDQDQYLKLLEQDNVELAQQVRAIEGRLSGLEEEVEARDSEVGRLRYELDLTRADTQDDDAERPVAAISHSTVAAAFKGEATPHNSLVTIAWMFPERVVVLPSALKSAKKAEGFKHRKQAHDLLWKLVTDYAEKLQSGKGDAEARQVFGANEFAARESEKVESNAAGRKRRTFDYKGRPTPMMRHLKIGRKDSAAETLRIHFHWDAEERCIVIGHCGPHLDFD